MTSQALYVVAQGTADDNGKVVLKFPDVPQGLTWSGSITTAVNPSAAAVVGTTIPTQLFGATWTITINNVPILSYQGLQLVNDFQATSRQTVVITGFGLAAGTNLLATWTGESDAVQNVVPLGPSVSGLAGNWNLIMSSGTSIFANPSPIILASTFNNTSGSTKTVIPVIDPVSSFVGRTMYLLSYTLGSSQAQLSTTAGTHGLDVSIMAATATFGNIVIDQVNTATVPSTTDTAYTAQNFMAAPLPLGLGTEVAINLVLSASTADVLHGYCSVVVMYI